MTLDAIHSLHQPQRRYRVSWDRYSAGVEFDGYSQPKRLYVLSGSCRITVGGIAVRISSGEYADLSGGAYKFAVCGDSPVELVRVYEIPEAYQQTPEDS